MKLQFVRSRLASFLTVIIATILLTPGISGASGTGTMYVQQNNVMVTGSTVTLQVRVNSGGTNVNAVEADFTYPTNLLTYVSTDVSTSAFDTTASTTGGSGSVSIQLGSTANSGAGVTGDQQVANVTFNVLAHGTADVVFQNSSVLLASSDNTNILTTMTGGTFGSVPVYRLSNYLTHERLFTIDANERNNAVAKYPGWVYDGVAYYALPSSITGSVPVYRLSNYLTHERLFTIDANERNNAVAKYPGWVYDGVAYYALPSSITGSVPVYRLSNYLTHERLFTIDANERNNAVAKYPGWVYDGVAYYALP